MKRGFLNQKEFILLFLAVAMFLCVIYFLVILLSTVIFMAFEVDSVNLWRLYGCSMVIIGLVVIKKSLDGQNDKYLKTKECTRIYIIFGSFFLVVIPTIIAGVTSSYGRTIEVKTFWQYCIPCLIVLGTIYGLAFIAVIFASIRDEMRIKKVSKK